MAAQAGSHASGWWPTSECRRLASSLLDPLAKLMLEVLSCPPLRRFIKLPAWVSVLLTSRPQVESSFLAWTPVRILPADKRNEADLRVVLRARLKKLVNEAEVDSAVELLLARSKGEFIYSKFAFEALQAAWDRQEQQQQGPASRRWSLAQLEQSLPSGSGVESTFLHSLIQLRDALAAERPELLEHLTKRVLPVLAVCRELLTVQELAWAVAAPEEGVRATASRCPVAFLPGVLVFC